MLKGNFHLKNFSLRSLPTAPINKQFITRGSNKTKTLNPFTFYRKNNLLLALHKRHTASIKQNFIQAHAKLV